MTDNCYHLKIVLEARLNSNLKIGASLHIDCHSALDSESCQACRKIPNFLSDLTVCFPDIIAVNCFFEDFSIRLNFILFREQLASTKERKVRKFFDRIIEDFGHGKLFIVRFYEVFIVARFPWASWVIFVQRFSLWG